MEKNQTKPNDIFVATFNAPNANILDFLRNGIDATNTSIYEKKDYANTPFVKKRFTDENGVFRQDEFDKVYEKAYDNFHQLADQNAFEGLKEYLTWDKNSTYKPQDAKIRDTSYKAETLKNNPLQQSIGLSGLNQRGDIKLTEEEVAQGNRIWDSKNKKWLSETAENRNLFKKALGETLVYAKYEKTGTQINPVTGEEGYHYKGEWIKDENGNYFTETLGDRQLLDKQVVALEDILTEEGSVLNKFDFWDSDGYDKSIGGIAMKTAVQILPYLTPIRGYYGAFTMALQIASTMPALYKSLESIVLGENQSAMTSTATQLENWFAKWNGSKSRKGREGFWNIESLGELAADTFGQLFQQRAAAKLAPTVLAKFDKDLAKAIKYEKLMAAGKTEEALALNAVESIKKMNSVSSGLAFAYMGLTQGADMYNESLKMGYDRTTAGLVSLATMGALFGIMKYNAGKNGLGTWFLDKTTGYDHEIERGTVSKLAKEELNTLRKIFQKAVKQGDTKKLAYAIREWKRKGASLLHDAFIIGGEDLWKGFLVEGTEEVTEEVVQDMVKGLADTMSWLGWTAKEGSFGGWDNVFSKEGLSRYLSTFVGGGFGGAIFAAQNKWINPGVDSLFGINKGKPDANQQRENYELATIILDGRFDEYMHELDNCKKFIKNSLDATIIEEGDLLYNISTQGKSQADLVIKLAKEKAMTMKNLLETAVGDFNKLSNFERRLVASHFASIFESKGFGYGHTEEAKEYLNEQFNQAAAKILDARETYAQFTKESKDMTDEEKEQKKIAKKELDDAVEEFKNFFDAKHYAKFSIDGALLTRPYLLEPLMNISLQDYARNQYDLDYDTIEDEELKNKIKDEWESIKQTITKENISEILPKLRNVYLKIFNTVSPELSDYVDGAQAIKVLEYIHSLNDNEDLIQEALFLASMELDPNDPDYELKKAELENKILNSSFPEKLLLIAKLKPEFLSISARHDFDLYSAIKPALTIDTYGDQFSPAQEELIKRLINEQASRSGVDIWSKEHVQEFINSIQNALSDESNIYYKRLFEQRRNDLQEDQKETKPLNPITIKLDITKIPDNIRSIKINSLQSFANQYTEIDSELKENLIRMYLVDAIDRIDPNNVFMDEYGNDLNMYDEKLVPIIKDENFEKLSNSQKLQKIIDLRNSFEGDDIAVAAWNTMFPENWINEAKNLLDKPVVENKMVSLLKKLYVGIHGSDRGKRIFDFLENKSKQFNTQEGLNQELSLTDEDVIESASKTLNLILSVIQASVGTKFGIDPNTGLNTVLEGGIIDYGKHFLEMMGEDSSAFKPINEEGARIATGYIVDLAERLDQVRWFNKCLGEYKNKLDDETRRQYNIGFAHALLSKEIKIGSISIPPVPKDKIPDDPLECELQAELKLQEIHDKIQSLLTDKSIIVKATENSQSVEEYLVDLILSNFDIEQFGNSIKKANELCTWDDNNQSGQINQYWIAKRIVEQLITSRIQIQEDLKDIQNNIINMHPKFDQMLAMEEMLYYAYDIARSKSDKKKILDYFTLKINKFNKSIIGQKDNLDPLENILSILGGPGSGKTFLLQATKTKLEQILGNRFVVSAMSKKKVDDLASDLGITEKEDKSLVIELLNKMGINSTICDGMDNASQIITEAWNTQVYQKFNDKFTKNEYSSDEFQKILKTFVESINGAQIILDEKTGLIIGLTIDVDTVRNNEGDDTHAEAEFYFYSQDILISTLTPKFTKYPDINIDEIDYNLMIDESTLVHPGYLAILSQIMKQNNKMLIISGDRLQQGYLVESGDQKADFTYHNIFYLNHTPMLISSYRFTNNLKTRNISLISSLIEKWESTHRYGINSGKVIEISHLPELKESLEQNPLSWQKLKSGQNSGRFIGDKIVNNSELFVKDLINYLVPEINDGKSLAVVCENETDVEEIKSILKNNGINPDNTVFLTATDIQGGEYDYVISYKLKKSKSDIDLDFDIAKAYTVLSRSKFGTLIYDEADGLFINSGIKSNSQESRDGFLFAQDNPSANMNRIKVIEGIIKLLKENSTTKSEQEPDLIDDPDLKVEDPTSGNEPEEESDSEMEENVKIDIKDIFFGNGSILHAYYTRLGIDWREIGSKKTSEIFKDEPESILNLSDLEAFYWVNYKKKTKFNRKKIESLTIKELAKEFLKVKNRLVEESVSDEGKKYTFRYWCKTAEESDICYAKVNDDLDTYINPDKNGKSRILQLIQVQDPSGIWITIGKLGYNLDSEDHIISKTQAEYANPGTMFEFTIKDANDDQKELVKTYLKKNRKYKKINEFNKSNFGFVPYTSLRAYKFNYELTSKQGNLKDFDFYNDDQGKFSRLCLENILSLGYEIDTDDYWDPTDSIDPVKFKNWYLDFRLFGEEISDDVWKKKFKGLEKRTWIVLKQVGTENKVPVLINTLVTGNYLDEIPVTDHQNVKAFGFTQLVRALKYVVKQSSKISEDVKTSLEIDDSEKNNILGEALKILEIIKESSDCISAISEFLEIEDKKLIETDLDNLYNQCQKHQNSVSGMDVGLGGNEFTNVDEIKSTLLQKLDDKLKGFFFTSNTNSMRSVIQDMISRPNAYIVSRVYESPRYIFLWDLIKFSDENTPDLESMEETDIIQEIKDNIPEIKDENEIRSYILLLDPKFKSIKDSYINTRKGIIDQIKQLVQSNVLTLLQQTDVSVMSTESEVNNYLLQLNELENLYSENLNIMKRISEQKEICNKRLIQLQPKSGMTLDELAERVPIIKNVVNVYNEAKNNSEELISSTEIFKAFKGISTVDNIINIVGNLDLDGSKKLLEIIETMGRPSLSGLKFRVMIDSSITETYLSDEETLRSMHSALLLNC